MKYLLVLLVVLAVLWFVRNHRRSNNRPPPETGKQPTLAQPQDMVRCPVCAVHLPRADALLGMDGRLYCCADHRPRGGD